MILLQVSGLAKSVYYYTLSKADKDDKNKEIIDKIKEMFINNKEIYGYRRITLELRNQGYNVNHKKVYRIMVKLGLMIDDYINYYNYDRIKVKLKGLSPVNYRLQSSN